MNLWIPIVPAFYELLRNSSSFPTTSQPSRVEFQEMFAKLSREADGIVAVLVSGEISGTIDSALAAAEGSTEVGHMLEGTPQQEPAAAVAG